MRRTLSSRVFEFFASYRFHDNYLSAVSDR